MRRIMKNKHVISLLVVSTCLSCLALVFVAPNTSFGSQESITHPALTQNLVAASGDTDEEKEIYFVQREPNAEDQSIQSVKVEVAFVAFENSGGVGIENSKMYERLLVKREGAEIYKKWSDSIYGDDPKSLKRVVEKLSSNELPTDERVKNEGVESGAATYRQWMLETYKKNGADSLKRILKRK